MRKWCWKRLEEEWKNWQKLVMKSKERIFFVRQVLYYEITYNVEFQKHDSHKLFRSYEIGLKRIIKVLQLAGHKDDLCKSVTLIGHTNKQYFLLQKNLGCSVIVDRWVTLQKTQNAVVQLAECTIAQRITQGAKHGEINSFKIQSSSFLSDSGRSHCHCT